MYNAGVKDDGGYFPYGHVVYFSQSGVIGPDNLTARGNVIWNSGSLQFNGDSGSGAPDYKQEGIIAENNLIYNMPYKGISIINVVNSVIRNNIIYNVGLSSASSVLGLGCNDVIGSPHCVPPTNNIIANNIIIDNNQPAIDISTVGGNYVFNNIAVSSTISNAIKEGGDLDYIHSTSNKKYAYSDSSWHSLFVDWDWSDGSADYHIVPNSAAHNQGILSWVV